MIDSYIYVIIALLPLAAFILLFQVNPYDALIIRAILGAVAALVYAVLGAADVALTEALVGTMLAITLYVVAVRSSLVMRLGIVKGVEVEADSDFTKLISKIRQTINKYHLRLELVEYPNKQALEWALIGKEVHAICSKSETSKPGSEPTYQTSIRVHRLFEIMETELTSAKTIVTYITVPNLEGKH
ncbi:MULTISPECIES: DUF4040 domain-containing protein [Okeania]|uniref:DUF4040 domain-containing protein n=1 Tax=Okeania hirsuta TaxID=1458930 RepID=A0A3N6R9T9_9CYAN|nr:MULTISPECIES: DUF4040 domain-containing protein [Okeania]NES76511.1 DUF4040 domain-containing protein [Okeania sp. SIO1H4]NES88335.1 DUF4040 domain-containing protein [Okeania sp. SIO2B9]NET20377.1 DUF4040 domain-containing protein [Okeania sp. SIO1H5]NET77031.1 DUF4040 domain-containing protein [Okeania sp. SIO1F9]NET94643.1 DUF4040 domain-containing protein [Okeania sp. SIO1H2]